MGQTITLSIRPPRRTLYISNVCSASDDPQVLNRRSADNRLTKEVVRTLYKIVINYHIDIILSRLRFKIAIRKCRLFGRIFTPFRVPAK